MVERDEKTVLAGDIGQIQSILTAMENDNHISSIITEFPLRYELPYSVKRGFSILVKTYFKKEISSRIKRLVEIGG